MINCQATGCLGAPLVGWFVGQESTYSQCIISRLNIHGIWNFDFNCQNIHSMIAITGIKKNRQGPDLSIVGIQFNWLLLSDQSSDVPLGSRGVRRLNM